MDLLGAVIRSYEVVNFSAEFSILYHGGVVGEVVEEGAIIYLDLQIGGRVLMMQDF